MYRDPLYDPTAYDVTQMNISLGGISAMMGARLFADMREKRRQRKHDEKMERIEMMKLERMQHYWDDRELFTDVPKEDPVDDELAEAFCKAWEGRNE